MSSPVNNDYVEPIEIEPGFCELVKNCHCCELIKRIAKAVVDIFVMIGTGIYNATVWVVKNIYKCVTCKCGTSEEERAEGLERPEGPLGADAPPISNEPRRVQDLVNRNLPPRNNNPEAPRPRQNPSEVPVPVHPLTQKFKELYESTDSTEDLQEILKSLDENTPEYTIYRTAIKMRLDPTTPNPAPANDLVNAPGVSEPAPRPAIVQRGRTANSASFFVDGDFHTNRKKALDRVVEISNAIDTALNGLKLDPRAALMELAEIETGTQKGTLRRAPSGVLQRLKDTPVRVKRWAFRLNNETIPNAERAMIWPEGMKAADKLAELEKSQEKSLRRLAEIKTVELLYHIQDAVMQFDLDKVLEPYKKTNRTEQLQQWFQYVDYPQGDYPYETNQSKYEGALLSYEVDGARSIVEAGRTITEYLSIIHDMLTKRKKTLNGDLESFKASIRAFINTMIDGNMGCPDQMIGQVEERILTLLADNVKDSQKTDLDGFILKAGLALTHYRSSLIKAFTRELYHDETHMADLERMVKTRLAEDLGLNGRSFRTDAYYTGVQNIETKSEKIKAAVLADHNPMLFLLDNFRDNQCQVFTVVQHLRSDIIQYVSNSCNWSDVNLDEATDPLIKALSAEDKEYKRVTDGGVLTFEGMLFLLESAGVIARA